MMATNELAPRVDLSHSQKDLLLELNQRIQREVNILADPASDRSSKRRALERIEVETLGSQRFPSKIKNEAIVTSELLKLTLLPSLIKCFSDPIEKCRELAINILFE